MKNLAFILLFSPMIILGQFGDTKIMPAGWDMNLASISSFQFQANHSEIDRLKELKHCSYICATTINTNLSFDQFSLVNLASNGDKLYQLRIESKDALGMMIHFENLVLEKGAKLWIYDVNKKNYIGTYTSKDLYSSSHQFLSSTVNGSQLVIEYLEPKHVKTSNFAIDKIYHYFRGLKGANGFRDAANCMLNAGCSEGTGYPVARDATCRIVVTGPNFSGFCTGSLVNNTRNDLTPYVLTANHCSAKSSIADLENWEFHFFYQSTGCANPSSEPDFLRFKGSTAPAYSGSDNGENSSDFLLLKINQTLPRNQYVFSYVGWDRSGTASTNSICYSHPQGDIKKVSSSTIKPVASSYGSLPNSHFQVYWASTKNGHSVTEGGSSGSGLINSSGHLIGTLTGGASTCSNKFGEDLFGRFSMHWNQFGTATNQRVDKWLDPTNSGVNNLKTIKSNDANVGISTSDNLVDFLYFRDGSTLQISEQNTPYQVNVYNLLGAKLVSNRSPQGSILRLGLEKLSTGIYILELETKDGRIAKKIHW